MSEYHLTPATTFPSLAVQEAREKRRPLAAIVLSMEYNKKTELNEKASLQEVGLCPRDAQRDYIAEQ
jgi:hypothetical protein